MSAWAESKYHTVTVTVEYDSPDDEDDPTVEVAFECTAPEDAKCRTYPECDCETFSEDPGNPGYDSNGHPYVPGRTCWVRGWFDAGPDTTEYAGDDMNECNPHYVPTITKYGLWGADGITPLGRFVRDVKSGKRLDNYAVDDEGNLIVCRRRAS